MNKNLQNIDKIFFQHLDEYKEQPPEDAWNTIENELNKKDAALYKRKYLWLKKMLVCAGFITAFLLLSNVLQPVLNKYGDKVATNFNVQQSGDSTTRNNKIIPNILPGKSSYLGTETDISISNLLHKKGDLVSVIKPQPVNDKTSSVADIKPNTGISETEDIIRTLAPDQLLPVNDDKQNLSSLNANKTSVIKTKQKHWFYIIPYFSVDRVTGRIKSSVLTDTSNLPPFKKERLDIPWTAGLLVEKEISKKVSLQTGLLHSYWTKQISPAVVKALQDNSGDYKLKLATDYGYAELKNTGNIQSGDSAIVTNGVVKLQSLFVPVTASVHLKSGKLKLNAVAGGSVNFITADIAEIEYELSNNLEKDHIQKLEGLRKSYLTVVAGAEANYSINKRISIGLNPVARYAITPVNKSTLVKTYPVNLGIGASVRIKL